MGGRESCKAIQERLGEQGPQCVCICVCVSVCVCVRDMQDVDAL